MTIKALVVDDDRDMLALIKRRLTAEKFAVTATGNSLEALALARKTKPDITILDAEMPGIDGLELSRLFRKDPVFSKLPIIIISGKHVTDEDIIEGLELGADDYLLKPLSFDLLLARIRTVLRRYETCRDKADRIRKLGLELNPQSRVIKVKDRLVVLTRKEFDLLAILLNREGTPLNDHFLLENVWDRPLGEGADHNTVETHIFSLRKKLGAAFSKHITTVAGHGYKFE